MNFFKNCVIIENAISICRIKQFPKKEHWLKTFVQQNERYRPDMISYRLFNNVNYAWVLDEMNDFYHGFKDYEIGKEIFYLKAEDLQELGIIR